MEPQDKRFGIIGNPDFRSIFLKHRSRGMQYDIDSLVDGLRKDGAEVIVIGEDSPRKGFAGNFMLENPPVKRDPDFPLMSFNTEVVMEPRPEMSFPHKSGKAIFLSAEDYDHYFACIARWWFTPKLNKQVEDAIWGKSPDFDPMRLHRCLRDEAASEKDFDLDKDWERFKNQRSSGRVMVEEFRQELLPQMFSKGRVAGESKPIKHNPRPSRFGFLEGLPKPKRR